MTLTQLIYHTVEFENRICAAGSGVGYSIFAATVY